MLTSTTFGIDGHRVTENLGMVRGIIVRAPTISQGVVGSLKSIVGGRIGSYTKMCEQARSQAFEDLVEHARQLGANAVIGIRYDASDVARGCTEVLCYGTAVNVIRE